MVIFVIKQCNMACVIYLSPQMDLICLTLMDTGRYKWFYKFVSGLVPHWRGIEYRIVRSNMLLTGRKVIINKVITIDLVIENVIFTQQCLVLPITNPIILGSDFLDTHFAMLDIGDCTYHYLALHWVTCLLPASPMILYIISTFQK